MFEFYQIIKKDIITIFKFLILYKCIFFVTFKRPLHKSSTVYKTHKIHYFEVFYKQHFIYAEVSLKIKILTLKF